ncbi:ATPase, T2SS/T4P/T4SS family [Aeromonas salmonicida]|uniref:ATPase, T2SS/T4P/T4SS family n=1 Tax=Aeromonas salmonicida TaxID=645 RepID=UPI003D07439E
MSERRIDEVDFIDLYLFAKSARAECTTKTGFIRLEENDFSCDIKNILEECYQTSGSLIEFTLKREFDNKKQVYRGTKILDAENEDVFILRKVESVIRSLPALGVSDSSVSFICSPEASGIVLVSGRMSSGKTSTAGSIVNARLNESGGIAFILEDPPETKLNGPMGKGRCIQVHANRQNGGYQEQIILALRSGAQFLMVGEIRDSATAREVVNAGSAGHMLVTTIHADSISSAVERLVNLSGMSPKVAADCVSLVFHQTLEKTATGHRLQLQELKIGSTERAQIRDGKFGGLDEAAEQQRRAARTGLNR